MKPCDMPATMLAAALFGLGVPAATVAADGSRASASTNAEAEYGDAVRRADKDFEAANRRCEVLGMEQRNLCRHDSTLARRAAIAEAQAREKETTWNTRAQPTTSRR
jgi:hypothetical protein